MATSSKLSPESAAIVNIGKIVSGDFNRGVIDGSSILIENGKISAIGEPGEIEAKQAGKIIDANGMVVCPGFIDPHVHVSFDDYAPMQRAVGFMEESLLWGTTTLISEGEQGSGLPRFYDFDPVGVKLTAMLAKRVYDNFRPGGALKVHAGAIVLARGLTEGDFKEMAEAGIWLVGEIGGGGLAVVDEVLPMVDWARKYKMLVSVHYGPRLIPGATTMSTDAVLRINPDKVAHANGGTTAGSLEQTRDLIEKSRMALELVTYGNPKMKHQIVQILKKRNELGRLILGSDCPTGQGYMPTAMQRGIITISSIDDVPAEKVIAMATGNTADLYHLNTGKIEVGRDADIIIIDKPPGSSGEDALDAIQLGDTFGTAMIMVDGQPVGLRGRDTRPITKNIKINGVDYWTSDINEYLFDPPRLHYRSLPGNLQH